MVLRTRLMLVGLAFLGAAGFAAMPMVAQETGPQSTEAEKNAFVRFVEDRLSTPERQIRLSNIDGVLSSDASINEITIADQQGVWLKVTNAAITWNQAALFTGRLEIRTLTAQSIDYLRNPVPAEGAVDLPPPEAGGIALPELPVAVILERLDVHQVSFGESVFGLGSAISVTGNMLLEGGSLDTALDIVRLDGPGGTLGIKVKYVRGDGSVDVGLDLVEPSDGIIANLLNIEGRPEVRLALAGKGPISDLVTNLTLDAGGKRALTGTATVREAEAGFAVDADLRGPVSTLVPESYRPFFGAETALKAKGLVRSAGGLAIEDFALSGGQLALTASGETTPDNFLSALHLKAKIADASGGKVLLPVAGADTMVQSADVAVDFGGNGTDAWTTTIKAAGFENATIGASDLSITAGGIAANLADPATRRITFNGDGLLSGVTAANPDVAAALGKDIGFGIAGLWNAGAPVELAELRLEGKALSLLLSGAIDDFVFDGKVGVRTSSLSTFSGLAGRDLGGGLDLAATGTISPLIGGFNLILDGTGTNLKVDDEALDPVLAGTVRLTGRVARTEQGLEAEQFKVANDQVQLLADGAFATGAADFVFRADLSDLGLLSKQASGALSVVGTAKGQEGVLSLNLDATLASGALAGRPLRDGALGFAGTLTEGNLDGDVTGLAFLDGHRVDLASHIAIADGERRLTGLAFEAGGTSITGNVTQTADGLFAGRLNLKSSNLATAAALALVEASGSANASIVLENANGKQSAGIGAALRDLVAMGTRVGSADVKLSLADLFGVPMIDGAINGENISAAGVSIESLAATATRNGEATSFDGTARLANNTSLALTGSLAPQGENGFALGLTRADLTQGRLSARLAEPARLVIDKGSVALDTVRLDVGGGRITATGTAGETLAIDVVIEALPLSIANAIAPDLGLAGTIAGTARITGASSDPQASFDLKGAGLNAAAISEFGIAPLTLAASGAYQGNVVSLQRLTASGASGLSLTGSGTVPLAGSGLNLSLEGSAPLQLANRFVADRGGQASGTLSLSARVAGSLAGPQVTGKVSTSGAQYVDPELNLRLNGITGSATLTGDRISIDTLTATLATGGTVSASGSLNFAAPGLPADLRVRLNSARYADGNMVVATLSGDLALTGPVTQGGLLSGDILVEKADITIPNAFGGSADLIEVQHRALPKDVAQTLARGKVDERGPRPTGRPSVLRLDVNVRAPNQIFVRGRGLDAELGGAVRLTGFVNNIVPVGGFELNRGRLAILGQRVTFDSGTVSLIGDLDPVLNFVARTEGEGITVFITVSGPVSNLDIGFSSAPALPQDEVLSRLLFKRGVDDLSPLQLARLAGAAAELAGGSNSSLVNSLRDATGLDDLEFVTDEKGNAAVQAGSYLQDNIYLGVQAGANGQSKVSIDLDITSDIKARGTAGSDGSTSLGVFYEKDY